MATPFLFVCRVKINERYLYSKYISYNFIEKKSYVDKIQHLSFIQNISLFLIG